MAPTGPASRGCPRPDCRHPAGRLSLHRCARAGRGGLRQSRHRRVGGARLALRWPAGCPRTQICDPPVDRCRPAVSRLAARPDSRAHGSPIVGRQAGGRKSVTANSLQRQLVSPDDPLRVVYELRPTTAHGRDPRLTDPFRQLYWKYLMEELSGLPSRFLSRLHIARSSHASGQYRATQPGERLEARETTDLDRLRITLCVAPRANRPSRPSPDAPGFPRLGRGRDRTPSRRRSPREEPDSPCGTVG